MQFTEYGNTVKNRDYREKIIVLYSFGNGE